jgi:hypothetical protein
MTAKTRAIRSLPAGRQACTVTTSWQKYQDFARCLRRVTQPPHIAEPFAATPHIILHRDNKLGARMFIPL